MTQVRKSVYQVCIVPIMYHRGFNANMCLSVYQVCIVPLQNHVSIHTQSLITLSANMLSQHLDIWQQSLAESEKQHMPFSPAHTFLWLILGLWLLLLRLGLWLIQGLWLLL